MSEDLGSAHGSVTINAASALATLAALRRKSAATVGTLNTIGRASILAGAAIGGVGLGIAGLFALAVNKSADLEKRISYIKGISNIQGKQVDVLRDKIIQLGQDSAYTANEVADGFTELSKAGASTEQLIGGVGDAMITLGQSADIGLTDAASALISISSTFNLLPKDAAHIADIMQGAANASIISVEDMAVSFKYAGGVAANLGLSMEDTATAIALLGNAGIRGSTAGTSLRRIFLQLTPRTKQAYGAMQDLGIITKEGSNRFYDAAGKAKSLSKITEILYQSTKNLTPELKQKALATIFGDRAINSAIALSKGGAKAFQNMYKKVGSVKAADVAKERLNNLAGAWEILKGSIDSALIKAGAPAQKPLKQLVELVTKLVNAFTNLSPHTQEMIVRFALITAGLFLLVGGFLIVMGTMLRAGATIMQLVNIFKLVSMQVKFFIAVMRAANGSLLLSPIGLIVVALIALGIGLVYAYKHSERFRKIVDATWAAVKRAAVAVWNFIKAIPGAVADAWHATSNWFQRTWNTITGFVSAVGSFLKSNWYTIVLTMLGGPFGLIIGLVIKFRSQIWSLIKSAVSGLIGILKQLPYYIGFMIGFIIGRMIRFTLQFYSLLYRAGQSGVNAIMSFLIHLPGRIWNIMVATAKFILKAREWLHNLVVSIGRSMYHGIVDFLLALPGRIWKIMLATAKFLLTARQKLHDLTVSIGRSIYRGIFNGVKNLPGTIRGALGKAIQVFKDMIAGAWKAAKGFGKGLWDGFKKGLFGSPRTKIEYAVEGMTDTVGKETKTLAGQMRQLHKIGATMPALDSSLSGARISAVTPGARDGYSSGAAMGARTMIVNVNNPSRQTVTRSYDRGLKDVAYANGWNK